MKPEIEDWILSTTGKTLNETPPKRVEFWTVVEGLWSLNEVFRPHIEAIRTIKYRARSEGAADDAILAFVNFGPAAWTDIPQGAWRVLLERHMQMIVVASANQAAGETTVIPSSLRDDQLTSYLMLFWLLRMKLPFPAKDRSDFELPASMPDLPLRQH
ncbi:hypothetical protein [Thalassospira marina]|uniref:Uncharacterized protein n=1 Tax=Thalassospira marina TaxID=2048283 RepID=A0A2N3KYE0_9PROT|nr:hypothetical protein [Thalassospira marina]PKR55507.1 hypothetical protein COO20_04880 [Thalassospira marina]